MENKTALSVQNNICGISELGENFPDEKRPFFVCLNETKKFSNFDFFNNFHTEASQTGSSGGVAFSLNQEIFYTGFNHLECPDLDSVWIWAFSETSNY